MNDEKKSEKRIVIIDHLDSFTYNLVVAFESLGVKVDVVRTDGTLHVVESFHPTHIVLSPGPGHPKDVKLFQEALTRFKEYIPILGVCLGQQAIGIHFGSDVDRASHMMHGKTSSITHGGKGIFAGMQNPFEACRYHSLAIVPKTIKEDELLVTAMSDDGTIMGVQSKKYPNVVGVQFHPESHFTKNGILLLQNFLA